jgi:hypothetical protein
MRLQRVKNIYTRSCKCNWNIFTLPHDISVKKIICTTICFYSYLILHSGYMCIHTTLVQTFLLLIATKKKTLGYLMYKFIILFFLVFSFFGWHKWNKCHCKERDTKEMFLFCFFYNANISKLCHCKRTLDFIRQQDMNVQYVSNSWRMM